MLNNSIKISLILATIFFLFTGAALSMPFMELKTAKLRFEYVENSRVIRTGYYSNKIGNTSFGTTDSIIGARQILRIPEHRSTDHQLVDEIAPGVWSLTAYTSTEEAKILVGSGKRYFEGTSIATYIDFNNGEIGWDPITDFSIRNTSSRKSETLEAFSDFSTLHMDFTFTTSPELQAWVDNPDKKYFKTDYKTKIHTSVTATPEPGQWALMLSGLGVLGFAVYKKKKQITTH